MKKLNTRMITVIGVLIAMEVILSRFLSINAPSVKIGFAFVPSCVGAYKILGSEKAKQIAIGAVADYYGTGYSQEGKFIMTAQLQLMGIVTLLYDPHGSHNTVQTPGKGIGKSNREKNNHNFQK